MSQQTFVDWLLELGYDYDDLIDFIDEARQQKSLELFMCWYKGISPDLYSSYHDDIRGENEFK